jgi:Family of unknown function (DUF5946)
MNLLDNCPDCGAKVENGRTGCQALWDELIYVRGISNPAGFDAYCMQHLEKYCASAKSYAAHLTRLCCGLEYDGSPQVFAAVQRWLNGRKELEKPALLPNLGTMTIADVAKGKTAEEQFRLMDEWVQNVWAAYTPHHELAHSWIQQALSGD